MIHDQQKIKGFTLLEMLLVLAISSSMIVLLLNYTSQKTDEMRRDKTVLQMQQILNAGLSYYVNNSVWPTVSGASPACGTAASNTTLASTIAPALVPNYLPTAVTNVYGNGAFTFNCTAQPGNFFYVYTKVDSPTTASIIAGRLPMAYTADTTGIASFPPAACGASTTCNYVVTSISIPGQNLNNARSVNYAGTYSPSACVPAPNCPAGMQPAISVIPAAVNGVYDPPTCVGTANSAPYNPEMDSSGTNGCTANVYPVSSFTAYAVGGPGSTFTGGPVAPGTPGTQSTGPYDCQLTNPNTQTMPCLSSQGNNDWGGGSAGAGSAMTTNVLYWRVCLAVITQKGQVSVNNVSGSGKGLEAQWGKMSGSIVAFTRCVPNNGTETPISSGFDVWQSNFGYAQ